jgi:hypothetical protein
MSDEFIAQVTTWRAGRRPARAVAVGHPCAAPTSRPTQDGTRHEPNRHGNQFDVTIIGSGLGGSTLAAALARNGVKVLLLDGGTHPRFAVGEATIPYTNGTQRLIADGYGIPELKNLCSLAGRRGRGRLPLTARRDV